MNFAKNIALVRDYFSTTNAGLEKILLLSNGYISALEKNGTDNPGKLLLALKAKGISTDWFLTGEGEMLFQKQDKSLEPAHPPEPIYKIPLLNQRVSCGHGAGWEDEQNIEKYVDIFSLIPGLKIGKVLALSVQGNSMVGAGIKNGDYVLFSTEELYVLKDGIYVFSLDGEVFCKLLEFDRISKRIKIYSVRVTDLEKAELLETLNIEADGFYDRFHIYGRVLSWVHPNSNDM